MPTLPQEILEEIFKYLSPKDNTQCQLTCRRWEQLAQEAVYKEVEIVDDDQMTSFLQSLATSVSLPGKLIRHINIKYPSEEEVTDNYPGYDWDSDDDFDLTNVFTELAKHSPNLESIDLSRTSIPFWKDLLVEWKKGNWKYLTKIPYPECDDEVDYYFRAILAIHDKVKEIMLCDCLLTRQRGSHSERFKRMVNKMKYFIKVEKLTYQRYNACSLKELDSVIEDLPSLKELNLWMFPSEQETTHLDSYDMSSLIPSPKIKKLNASMILGSERAFIYIMNKFPKLENLQINCTEENESWSFLRSTQPAFSRNSIQKITDYLLRLKRVHIKDINFKNIGEFVIDVRSKLGRGNLEIEFIVDYGADEITYRDLQMTYNQYENNNHPHIHMTAVLGADLICRFTEKVQKIGRVLDELTVYAIELESFFFFIGHKDCKKAVAPECYLDHICTTYPNLKILTLIGVNLIDLSFDMDTESALQILCLKGCAYSPFVLHQISDRFPKLKVLRITSPRIVEANGSGVPSKNTNIYIDMPHSSLDLLGLEGIGFEAMSKHFYIKVTSEKSDKYYRFTTPIQSAAVAEEFEDAVRSPVHLTIHVRCKDIGVILVDDVLHSIIGCLNVT